MLVNYFEETIVATLVVEVKTIEAAQLNIGNISEHKYVV